MNNEARDKAILEALKQKFNEGKNILLTGQAGTGKTHTLNMFMDWLKEEGVHVGLAGSTGIAAINIGGTTIHRMFGINRASNIEEFVNLLKFEDGVRKTHAKRLKELLEFDIIIIDEVSMVGSPLFELLDFILRKGTGSDEPFGGMQVMFTGDFLQLPPIVGGYAFESRVWEEARFSVIHLTKVHRQSDPDFLEVLSKVRLGIVDDQVENFIESKMHNKAVSFEATKLYARNVSVDSENEKMLDAIPGKERVYIAELNGEESNLNMLKKGITALEDLRLKVGVKVMALRNGEDLTYVNGSIGTVIRLASTSVVVEFENGEREVIEPWTWTANDSSGNKLASFTQIPLRPAYAITIHKSQGMTIDGELIIDCNGIRSDGQFYVALSRIKDPSKLKITNYKRGSIQASSMAKSFYGE